MTLFETSTEIKIPFFDLDPMGIVWQGNYVKYMEVARCDMFSKLNYTYMDMKKEGVVYPVAKMETKFIEPLVFEQEIIVKTQLVEIEPAIIIKYLFFDKKTNKKVFKGQTMQIGVNAATKETEYLAPNNLKEALQKTKEKKWKKIAF